MVVMALQSGVVDLCHLGMFAEEVNHLQRILNMALYTQAQCLNTLQQDESIKRRDGSTGIAQDNRTDAGNIGYSTYSIGKDDAMIRWIGLGQRGELVGFSLPVELATIDNNTSET